ncbi:site-2 protease family protein [Verrucomicrobium spinosum]|uniref:site-2 protease family protein n=1 Tax=Verrucomicrobium spinosum TaxID=2736 RepID=UPI0009462603
MESVLNALHYAGIIFLVIMVFNLMILVHEWGHFLAARWRGLKVDKFQIWFGAPIWKKTYNGVQYGLGWIPAGGFVALPQMAPMEPLKAAAGSASSFPRSAPWTRSSSPSPVRSSASCWPVCSPSWCSMWASQSRRAWSPPPSAGWPRTATRPRAASSR